MLESGIVYGDLTAREVSLTDYLTTVQLAQFITDARDQLESRLKSRGVKIRNLCKRLALTDATKSDEDLIERQRIYATVTGVSGTLTVALQGTNDDSDETYSTVSLDTALSFTTNTTLSSVFHNTFRYYKATKTGTGTITYYLVETSFELCHIYLSLMLAYKSLQALLGDVWQDKAKEYEMKFEDAFNIVVYSYDEDGDGEISDTEMQTNSITWKR